MQSGSKTGLGQWKHFEIYWASTGFIKQILWASLILFCVVWILFWLWPTDISLHSMLWISKYNKTTCMRYCNSRQDLQLGPVTSSLIVLRHETKEYHYFSPQPCWSTRIVFSSEIPLWYSCNMRKYKAKHILIHCLHKTIFAKHPTGRSSDPQSTL